MSKNAAVYRSDQVTEFSCGRHSLFDFRHHTVSARKSLGRRLYYNHRTAQTQVIDHESSCDAPKILNTDCFSSYRREFSRLGWCIIHNKYFLLMNPVVIKGDIHCFIIILIKYKERTTSTP